MSCSVVGSNCWRIGAFTRLIRGLLLLLSMIKMVFSFSRNVVTRCDLDAWSVLPKPPLFRVDPGRASTTSIHGDDAISKMNWAIF